MKGNRAVRIVIFILCILCCGCGKNCSMEEETVSGEPDTTGAFYFTEEDLQWKDNSLDAYSAAFSYELNQESPEGEYYAYLWQPSFGKNSLRLFQSFVSPKTEDVYQLTYVTHEGKQTRTVCGNSMQLWRMDEQGEESRICSMGSVLESEEIVLVTSHQIGEGQFSYRLVSCNEKLEAYQSIPIVSWQSIPYHNVEDVMVDKQGQIHVITKIIDYDAETMETYGSHIFYYLFDSRGEEIFCQELNPETEHEKPYLYAGLCPFFDGRVGLRCQFEYEDTDSNKTELGFDILWFDQNNVSLDLLSSGKGGIMDCILWQNDKILYADGTGVYVCDLKWENKKPLYLWRNHAVTVTDVKLFPHSTEGVSLLCRKNDELSYRQLIPTTTEETVTEITFAIMPHQLDKYKKFVDYFNGKYPTCKVTLVTDLGETKLNTQLIAGEGPVLIDTLLTGFEGKTEYWEPLDDFMKLTKLEEELLAPVLEACRVNGEYFGVVTDFFIETLLSVQELSQQPEWKYEDFISFIQQKEDCQAIFEPEGNPPGMILFSAFFTHGLEDSYWLQDGPNGQSMDYEHMVQIFDMIDTYCKYEDRQSLLSVVEENQIPFRVKSITDLTQVVDSLQELGEKISYSGYPSKDGAAHYMSFGYPITIRRSAEREEKKAAYLFLREFLSYEGQLAADKSSINFFLSVREDSLEDQTTRTRKQILENEKAMLTKEQFELLQRQLDEAEIRFKELYRTAKYKPNLPNELLDIIWEEVYGYIEGELPRDMALEHLKNRVDLFFSEQ